MPDEKKISKVVYHLSSSDTTGTTWMDVTQDTVTEDVLMTAYTATNSAGYRITGTLLDGDITLYGDNTVPMTNVGAADNMKLNF